MSKIFGCGRHSRRGARLRRMYIHGGERIDGGRSQSDPYRGQYSEHENRRGDRLTRQMPRGRGRRAGRAQRQEGKLIEFEGREPPRQHSGGKDEQQNRRRRRHFRRGAQLHRVREAGRLQRTDVRGKRGDRCRGDGGLPENRGGARSARRMPSAATPDYRSRSRPARTKRSGKCRLSPSNGPSPLSRKP